MTPDALGIVEAAIARSPIPGAAAAIGGSGAAEDRLGCFGRLEPDGQAVTPDTWYDLASLTKVLCTVPLCLEWIAAGRLDPQATVRELVPEVAWLQEHPNLGDVTVLQLATHTSGLRDWQPLYTLGLDPPTLFARLLHVPVAQQDGNIVYSDLGYMLLGHLLERLSGRPLRDLARELYARLGLDGALGFGPPPAGAPVAPTEHCPWRGRVLRGEVHDENAAALGGAAGHAGLFGTLRGVCGYARALLGGQLHSPAVVAYLTQEHARSDSSGERRGFGWILMHPGWSGGDLMSARSVGHTGFTGTGVWIDLDRGRFSVLLTNWVHPSRHVESGIIPLRRAFNHAAHSGLSS